ncbi:MAG: uroporphyrinogen-III synthase [Crocinitomicaceae bacterium]|nr:uroporphyrinogen-III synthase [Crocinitomicaceae bacterium]
MSSRLFISKNTSEVTELISHLENQNAEVIAHSFLQFEAIEFAIAQTYDIIFFSSPRSVLFFKSRSDIPINTLIACTGPKTAQLLKSMGHKINFVGEKSGDINSVAESFKIWAGEKTVLFPISNLSLRSISSALDPNQVIELDVYKTSFKEKKIDACQTYVFTSPSNVEGFLLKNRIPQEAKVIAWGTSTASKLVESRIEVNHTLEESSVAQLIKILN